MKEKILSKIIVKNTCWEWTGSTYDKRTGYGAVYYGGRMRRAHRVAFELFTGTDPKDLCVLHKCDNTRCVNPDHLFLGTQLENIKDRDQKKRTANGTRVHNKKTKLTIELVKQIKALQGSDTQFNIGKKFNVDRTVVGKIWLGKSWSFV